MSSFSNQPEEFLDAYQYWDVNKLFMDLADENGKKTISRTGQKYLRGVLLYNSPAEIAQRCGLGGKEPGYTVRKYLSEIYPLIRSLLNLSEDTRIVYDKLPFLLQKYRLKNQPHNNYPFSQSLETSQRIEQNQQSVNISSAPMWRTLEDVALYLEKFYQHCEAEEYIDAFYTIYDYDDYDNCVCNFLKLWGYDETIRELYERLVQSWQPSESEKWEFAFALCWLGHAYKNLAQNQSLFEDDDYDQQLAQYQAATNCYQKSLVISEEINESNFIAISLVSLGDVYCDLENYSKAIAYSRRGLDFARKISIKGIEARALNNLGNIYSSQKQYFVALDYHHHALVISKQIGDAYMETYSLLCIGIIHRRHLGQYQEALSFLQQSIELAHRSGNQKLEKNLWGHILITLIELEEQPGQKSQAILAYKNYRELCKAMGREEDVELCKKAIQMLSEGLDHGED